MQTRELPQLGDPQILAIALAYLAVVAAIGIWAMRRTKTAGDFFVAGRSIGVWTLAIAAMASTISGFAFVGGPGYVYATGLGAVFLVLPASITTSMSAWVLAKRLRLLGEARGVYTIPGAIGARYRSNLAHGLSACAVLLAVVGYMATNILALGVVIDALFGTGLTTAVWVGMAITLAYSAAGGILAGVYTDVFQGSLMAVTSALVFALALKVGGGGEGLSGITAAITGADQEFLGPWGLMTPVGALSLFFVFGIGSLAQPHVVHKFYMLRDPRRLRWYPALMSAALVLTLLLYFSVGVATKALVARGEMPPLPRPDDATPLFVLRFAPTFLAGLVFAGIAAAIMSTVNSFMSIAAAAVTHDIPRALGRAVRDELRVGRVATVIVAVLAAILALQSTAVAVLGIFGWGLFASTLVPALAIGLNWAGATREGAIASIATGLVATLGFESLAYLKVYSPPPGATVAGANLVLSFLAFFLVSYATRGRAGARIDDDVRGVMAV